MTYLDKTWFRSTFRYSSLLILSKFVLLNGQIRSCTRRPKVSAGGEMGKGAKGERRTKEEKIIFQRSRYVSAREINFAGLLSHAKLAAFALSLYGEKQRRFKGHGKSCVVFREPGIRITLLAAIVFETSLFDCLKL